MSLGCVRDSKFMFYSKEKHNFYQILEIFRFLFPLWLALLVQFYLLHLLLFLLLFLLLLLLLLLLLYHSLHHMNEETCCHNLVIEFT